MKNQYLSNVIKNNQQLNEVELLKKAKRICTDINVDYIKRLREFVYELETERIDLLTPNKKMMETLLLSTNDFDLYEEFVEKITKRAWNYEQLKKIWCIIKLMDNTTYRCPLNRNNFLLGKVNEFGKCICSHCKQIIDVSNAFIDHIIPVARGGPSEDWNLQILCNDCNRRKGTKIWLIT